MTINIAVTNNTLDQTIRAFAQAIGTVEREVDRSLTVASLNLKRKWQQDAQGHGHLPGLAAAVEVIDIPNGKRVAFSRGQQAPLAHIANFGSYRSAPVMNVFAHVPAEVATLQQFMGQIGDPW